MADLSITSGSGTQSSTQSPQGLVSSGTSTAAASNVQPGTATTLLNSSSGITLHPSQLSTVNFTGSSKPVATTSSAAVTTPKLKHHVNGGLLGISIGLFVIAVIIFWGITRSAKNTTNNS